MIAVEEGAVVAVAVVLAGDANTVGGGSTARPRLAARTLCCNLLPPPLTPVRVDAVIVERLLVLPVGCCAAPLVGEGGPPAHRLAWYRDWKEFRAKRVDIRSSLVDDGGFFC